MQASYASAVKNWAARLGVYFPKERPQDVELLAAVARGERHGMQSFYLRYGPALHRVAKIMLGSDTDAEDLLHDVFCEAWEKAASYKPERGSVGAWLLVRLRSRAIDRIKSPRYTRLVALEKAHLEVAQGVSEDSPTATYLALVTRRNLDTLTAAQKRILQLLFYDDLSAAEVADELQIPLGTVKSRLARTLGHLRGDTLVTSGARDQTALVAASAARPRRSLHRAAAPATLLGGAAFREPPAIDQLESY